MIKKQDNLTENFIFEIICNNTSLNEDILGIYDLILTQNISQKDKKFLSEKILGVGIINEDHEVQNILKDLQKEERMHTCLLYQMIFGFIEDTFDVSDTQHIGFIQSNIKEEIETDIIYFLHEVLMFVQKEIHTQLWSREGIKQILARDYLNDEERNSLEKYLNDFFFNLEKKLGDTPEGESIKYKIKKSLEERQKILNIK